MTGTGASSPFIKDEPDDQLFMHRFGHQQQYNMSPQQFNTGQFASTPGTNGSINPNDLSMPMSVNTGSYMGGGFQNFNQQQSNPNVSFSKGISALDDDDLMDSLGTFPQMNGMNGMPQSQQNFNTGDEFDLGGTMYPTQTAAMSMGQHDMNNIYSSTPDGDPIQSPFVQNSYHQHMRHLSQFGNNMQTNSFASSPLASELQVGSAENYMTAKPRPRPSMSMQRKPSSQSNIKSPLNGPNGGMNSLNINGHQNFGTQPIRTSSHRKTPSAQFEYGVGSLQSFPGSGFSSPIQAGMHPNPQISDILKTGSMPAKLNGVGAAASTPALQTQEMKRRRRRESHNLVERRRRDNINERIQELSHLVPMHRLEDEKVRKALQNNSPLSPVLGSTSMSPPQATSGLAGPGARRATAGTITQGIPVEEKDKGPNKGDILNGSVSWTRDLMWMLHVKIQQQEELANYVAELGGVFPFEPTEDERRMQTELMDAMHKNGVSNFLYSRAPGTGLRVPKHTDYRGDPLGAPAAQNGGSGGNSASLSPNDGSGEDGVMGGQNQYWSGHNSGDGSGPASVAFKEEDEYGMDMTA